MKENKKNKQGLRWKLKIQMVFIFSLLATFINVKAFTTFENNTPIIVGEHIQLLTDRNMYAVQEVIYFDAFYTKEKSLGEIEWSKVLYVELLNQNGQVELQQKLPLNEKGTFGSLEIPGDLITGNYFLRAYTKWMSNFGPEAFSYAKIIVINPFEEQVVTPQSAKENIELNNQANYKYSNEFTVNTNKSSYKKREKVILEINLDKYPLNESNFVVSVVKSNTLDSLYMAGTISTKIPTSPQALNNITNMPENRGLSFSGTMNDIDGMPVKKGMTVNLSIVGDNPYFDQTLTTEEGKFEFTLPKQKGELNLFLCPAGNEETDVSFKVNNGFVNYHYPLSTEEFNLTKKQKQQAEELAINSQILATYPLKNISKESEDSSKTSEMPVYFYGKPEDRLFLDEYIVLPNLGEVFFELIPDVLLLKKKKISYLEVVNGNYWSSSMPMVLLDHIPIYDLSTILGIHSQRFKFIDVVNTNYLKGEMLYAGIISIFSKNNDIAGAELPKGGAFFSYKSFNEQKQNSITGLTQSEKNIPDLRNCLYWNPEFQVPSNQKGQIEFYTSDNTGEYTILIRKTDETGNFLELNSCKFLVE